ncbi:ATP-binding protein [Sulfitobacter sp. F26169L]|uniref:ATP-binding protein n=1 Tax=Sulfitobacter sp. F26169L TaxID=2996015 RepID=UPI0022609E1C|nr:ATP-binding protein [Sulfitobacter sp. F26169L]MCX7565645.1 ATP-binding protein [Sulfitobacter sp. F26169L]
MADDDRAPPFTVRISGSECAVRDGLLQVLGHIRNLNLSSERISAIELVLAEILNNIVEHALTKTHKRSDIEIQGHYSDRGLHLTVLDHGASMPAGRMPAALPPDVDVAVLDMPEGGFGWFMIHTLAQDISYVRADGQNRLSLLLALDS